MIKTKETTISEIKEFIINWGGDYSDWYIDIAANPRDRLFINHSVEEKQDGWIYRECDSSNTAREIEEYFVNKLGTDGGGGGGDYTTRFIYAYKKALHTQE